MKWLQEEAVREGQWPWPWEQPGEVWYKEQRVLLALLPAQRLAAFLKKKKKIEKGKKTLFGNYSKLKMPRIKNANSSKMFSVQDGDGHMARYRFKC